MHLHVVFTVTRIQKPNRMQHYICPSVLST